MVNESQSAGENSLYDPSSGNGSNNSSNSSNSSNNTLNQLTLINYIKSYSWPLAISLLSEGSNHFLASVRCPNGELPLHMSLKRSAPDNLVILLADLYPDAVHQTGEKDVALPLHLATVYCASTRVIITLLRKYPEALDVQDEDGDTPRTLVRKGLNDTARDAIMKPTVYWTTLLEDFRREAISDIAKTQDEKVTALTKKLYNMERKLEEAWKKEQHMLIKEKDLEKTLQEFQGRCEDLERFYSANKRVTVCSQCSQQLIYGEG
eukprot:CAMPEP_0172482600 /NCGR_PEP_ID=MMETSP1066-20121228/9093_1 /TAXON_ID=671091 /ORGANISM="Coscinodiscus wailesii, Strain CCMP2513" /LENGTH=263 /DNA_ID=CAMNT_0013245845 /DNA_START=41 /DNA_END=832 /DNA_ORIENTATION=-